jgi:hypothetical protein
VATVATAALVVTFTTASRGARSTWPIRQTKSGDTISPPLPRTTRPPASPSRSHSCARCSGPQPRRWCRGGCRGCQARRSRERVVRPRRQEAGEAGEAGEGWGCLGCQWSVLCRGHASRVNPPSRTSSNRHGRPSVHSVHSVQGHLAQGARLWTTASIAGARIMWTIQWRCGDAVMR